MKTKIGQNNPKKKHTHKKNTGISFKKVHQSQYAEQQVRFGRHIIFSDPIQVRQTIHTPSST